jgi:hypothetical protein
MTPSIFTVNNSLNVNSKKDTEIKSDLRYFFVIRNQDNSDNISFSVLLKNNHHSIINKVWFSAFIGIGGTKFAAGLDEQASFHIKNTNLGGAHYLSGYTKEEIKFPPETTLEILYFDIPKNKLSSAGSLEFCFGCESVKKISFAASWEDGEVGRLLNDEISSQNFLNFLKYKNQKTYFERMGLSVKRFYKKLKHLLRNIKGGFVKETNF